MKKTYSFIALIILFGGIALRYYAMVHMPMIDDERKNIPIAREISFDPENLHLPMEDEFVSHPLLNLYATKLGMDLIGENRTGMRFFHFIFGILTMFIVYMMAKRLGDLQGVMALFLIAFNQYHIQHSIRADNTSMLLFFSVMTIFLFQRAIRYNSKLSMILVGPFLGLAFLTKSVSLLLVPAFFIFLITTPKQYKWFKSTALYISVLLFGAVISPWIIWIREYGTSQLAFSGQMYDLANIQLRRTAINFFLIEPISWLEGVDYRLRISWEYAIVDGISGIILVFGTLFSLRHYKDEYHKLMFIIFFVMMFVLSFFALPGLKWGEFWWAELSLYPAICLTSAFLCEVTHNKQVIRLITLAFFTYLVVNAVVFVSQIKDKFYYPPHHLAAFVDDNRILAKYYEDKGDISAAIKETQRLLSVAPNSVENHSYLGWLYTKKGLYEKAIRRWVKAKEIEEEVAFGYNDLPTIIPKATVRYRTQIGKEPDNIKAHYMLAVLYYYDQQYEQSKIGFQKVLKLEPRHFMANYYLALSYLKLDKVEKSVAQFKKVITINPDYAKGHYMLGIAYLKLKQYEYAIDHFKTALSVNPDDVKSYYQLARAYEQNGYPDLAAKNYKQAKSIYHDDLKARYDFGEAYE